MPAANQESIQLHSILGYNGHGRENLVWDPSTGFFAYTVGCRIIVEDLTSRQQAFLTGRQIRASSLTVNDEALLVHLQGILKRSPRWPRPMMLVS